MYKLIVSDIDGTLIRSDFTISDYTKSVIQEAREAGVEFLLVTGRLFGAVKRYTRELKLDSPVISCNGGVQKDSVTGELQVGSPISKEALTQIFRILMDDEIYFHFYGEENFFSQKFAYDGAGLYRLNQSLREEDRFPMFEVKDPFAVLEQEAIYKVLFRCVEPEDRLYYKELFQQLPSISLTSSWSDNYEICAAGVNKGRAIQAYAESRGISREEIISFGDNINDIEMIQFAGMGVAVANAEQELLDVADVITESNEQDGVARAIERFVLGRQPLAEMSRNGRNHG